MRFSWILYVLLGICLAGCSCVDFIAPGLNPDKERLPPIPRQGVKEIHSDEIVAIIQDVSAEMKESNHLYLEDSKTFFDDEIHTIQIQYSSQDLKDINEARELIVDLTETLLERLNQNPILGTEFSNYPFRPGNLELYITFESYFGKYNDPLYVGWICMEEGRVSYYAFDVLIFDRNHWHTRCEPYCTAREIVLYSREAKRKLEEEAKDTRDLFHGLRYYREF